MKRKRTATKRRSVRRSAPYKVKRSRSRSRSSGMLKGWVPMNTEEHMYTFVAGASAGTINDLTKPLQDKYLSGIFGEYTDEAALILSSAAGYKFGKGAIKKFSSALYKGMIFTLGSTAGSSLVSGMVNKGSTSTQTNSTLGVVIG